MKRSEQIKNSAQHHEGRSSQQKSEPFSLLQQIKEKWSSYRPLTTILIFCLILSACQNKFSGQQSDVLMYSFMSYFLVFLSMFKFFNLTGFVDGFSTYDLIAKRFRFYGYLYPFIELFLGLAYRIGFHLFLINWIMLIIMAISGLGVLKSVLSGQKIKCACLGTVLNVPLSTVSILENLGMGGMAAYKLIFFF